MDSSNCLWVIGAQGEAPTVLFLVALSWNRGLLNLRKKETWKLGSTTGSQHHSPLNPHTTSVAEALLSSILSLGKLRLRKLKTLVEGMPVSCPEPHSDLFMSQAEFSVWAPCFWHSVAAPAWHILYQLALCLQTWDDLKSPCSFPRRNYAHPNLKRWTLR